MTQEEKAKAYDKAIEKIKYVMEHGVSPVLNKEDLQDIFPELKESEDERIRKSIIEHLQSDIDDMSKSDCPFDFEAEIEELSKYIAWLEKQGKQASAIRWYDTSLTPEEMRELFVEWDSEDATWHEVAFYHADTKTFWDGERQVENVTRWCYIDDMLEKQGEQKSIFDFNANNWYVSKVDGKIHNIYNAGVEPKFKVGDWIIFNEHHSSVYQVEKIQGLRYYLRHYNGGSMSVPIDSQLIRLWTIQDAKDGDVLYSLDSNQPFIYKERKLNEQAIAYCGLNIYGKFFVWGTKDCIITLSNYVPATKEERDALFAKMKEEGYVWDADKKELKKIEEQPSQWNISDYRTWQYIVSDVLTKHDGIGQYLDDGFCQKIAKYMQENWSKKLSLGQNPTEWSAEDDKILDKIITALMGAENVECADYNIMYDWLISLKERIGE